MKFSVAKVLLKCVSTSKFWLLQDKSNGQSTWVLQGTAASTRCSLSNTCHSKKCFSLRV